MVQDIWRDIIGLMAEEVVAAYILGHCGIKYTELAISSQPSFWRIRTVISAWTKVAELADHLADMAEPFEELNRYQYSVEINTGMKVPVSQWIVWESVTVDKCVHQCVDQ